MDVNIVSPPVQTSLPLPPGPATTGEPVRLALEFRWGATAADLRALWLLHEHQFPSSYFDADYYRRICDGRYAVLGAYTTKEGYTAAYEHRMESFRDEDAAAETPAHTLNDRSAAAQQHSCQEIYAGQFPPLLDAAQAENWAAVNAVVEEELYVMEQKQAKEAEQAGEAAAAAAASEAPPASPYVQLVGVVVSLLGYAEHESGHLLTNPTCYIGSIATDPILQSCGLGRLLLGRFADDVFHKLPLHASRYLHYDEQRMLKLVKANSAEKEAAAPAAAPHKEAAQETEGYLMTAARLLVPSFATWLQDLQARQALRAAGVSEAEITEQQRRDASGELTPAEQAMVDPIVQTGVREIFLHCLAERTELVAFYERYGFRLLRMVPNFYPMPDGTTKASCFFVLPAPKASASNGKSTSGAAAAEDLSDIARKKREAIEATIRRRHRVAETMTAAATGADPENEEEAEEAEEEKEKVRVQPLWLTDDIYKEVRNINLSAVENCRYFFQNRRAKLSWQDRLQEWVFAGNAIVAFFFILWWFYYKVLPWIADRNEARRSAAETAGRGGGGGRWFDYGNASADL